jgi:hypothetical protein
MDNFKIIYRILKILENAMDVEEFDAAALSPDALGISHARRNAIMEMLIAEGYIAGAVVVRSLGGRGIKLSDVRITLKGLEYLNDNSVMKKAAAIAKGIADLIP